MDGLCTVAMWEMRWARELVGGWTVYSGDVGDENSYVSWRLRDGYMG